MGGCKSDTVSKTKVMGWNPMQRNNHSIEQLKNEWGKEQFELMIKRIKQKEKIGFDEINFMNLFPNLRQYSRQTKKRIFKLFQVGDGKQVTSKGIVEALTIIHKCKDQNLRGKLVFYIYCDDEKKMRRKDLDRFKRENLKFLQQNLFDQHNPVLEKYIMLDDSQSINQQRFLNIFHYYQSEGFAELFSENIDELEEKIADIFRENHIIKRFQGQGTYIIQYKWFLQWKAYMRWKYGIDIIFQNEEKMESHATMRKNSSGLSSRVSIKKETRPGIIKNSDLMSDISDGLKQGLREMEDFVFMPIHIGQIMLQIYKMSPPITRYYPELYPVSVYRVFLGADAKFIPRKIKKKPYVTKFMSVSEFLFEAKERFDLKTDACFYKSMGNVNWQQIKKLSTKIYELQINRKVYFCCCKRVLAQKFQQMHNLIEKNGKKFIHQRIKNYGQVLDFPCQGVIKRGTVTGIDRYHVELEYKIDEYQFQRDKFLINELNSYNYSQIQKKVRKNCLAGLVNFQNNCYMNSVVQCIIRTHLFGEYLKKELSKGSNKEQLLLYSLLKVFQSSRKIQIINTKQFKKNVERYLPIFQGDQHQDAQQFLMDLLNQTAIEIKSMNEYKSFHQNGLSVSEKNQRVVQFFSGKRIVQTQCIVCQNKHENEEEFFTYSLSLPENKEEQFFFTFYPSKSQLNWGPVFYGLTLSKEVKNKEYMKQVSKLLGKPLERLFFVFASNGEWSGILQNSPEKSTYDYKNFGGSIIVYEVWNSKDPQIDLIKKKKASQQTIKIELRFRRERQSAKKYGSIANTSALVLQIDHNDTWEDLEFSIRDFISNFQRKKDPMSCVLKKKSQISKKDQKDQKYSALEQDDEMKYQIRIISKMRNDDMCFFCKKAFPSFFGKTWFQNSCKGSGCIFPKDKTLFESSKFLNEYTSICIVVDFQNPSKVDFPKKIEDHSWHEAKARKLSRKDELDSILKDNFTFKEELELKCSVENCPGEKAYRGERIKVFPNILLLHINRFRYKDGNQIKLENMVTYPDNFDFMGVKYLLYGVVAHYGGCRGGHYISYVCEDQQWFKCDDEKITKDNKKQHINPNVYLLFYRRSDFEPSLMSLRL